MYCLFLALLKKESSRVTIYIMHKVLAQVDFGTIQLPPGVGRFGTFFSGGPALFITNILKLLIVFAGLYAVFNFVLAGYAFMSAGGDPKKIADAWAKIWQTMLGLIVAAGAFIIAGIISRIIFGDVTMIFRIRIFGPLP